MGYTLKPSVTAGKGTHTVVKVQTDILEMYKDRKQALAKRQNT